MQAILNWMRHSMANVTVLVGWKSLLIAEHYCIITTAVISQPLLVLDMTKIDHDEML